MSISIDTNQSITVNTQLHREYLHSSWKVAAFDFIEIYNWREKDMLQDNEITHLLLVEAIGKLWRIALVASWRLIDDNDDDDDDDEHFYSPRNRFYKVICR